MIYVVLALSTFAAYEQVLRSDFVNFDDDRYITANPQVQAGVTRGSVSWAFSTDYNSNWHPLTWLSHMLDCQLYGLNSTGHHMTALLLHIVNTLLLFWVLKRMTAAVWLSAFVAAAFALHPVHVESVAWVSERKDVLSGFFWVLTMAAYVRYTKRPGIGRYLLVFVALSLGLMAKSMLVTLPFVLLLLDYWPLGRGRVPIYKLVMEKIPLFILVTVLSIVTYMAQQSGGSVKMMEALPVDLRIANALVSYLGYIGKMIYPVNLAMFYPYKGYSLFAWQPIVSLVVLVGILSAVIYTVRRWSFLAVGWLWYLGTMVPVIGLVQVGDQAMADRYTYLPSIGIFIMAAWGAAELTGKWRHQKIILKILAPLLLVAMLICTRLQVSYWQDSSTLFEHTLAVTENNYVIHYNLGKTLQGQGDIDGAIGHYRKALRIDPDFGQAHNNLGTALQAKGNLNEAIGHYREALYINPDSAQAHNNLALVLVSTGKIDEAIGNYRKALRINPDFAETHNNLGLALVSGGKINEAIGHYRQALRVNPNYTRAHYNLALALVSTGWIDEAIGHYREVLRVYPDFAEAHNNLGTALQAQGNRNGAIGHFREVLRIDPDSAQAYNNLAWVLATADDTKISDPAEAVELALRACELTDYNNASLLDTLATAYAAAGRFEKAIEISEKAIEIAVTAGENKLAEDIGSHLELYKQHK